MWLPIFSVIINFPEGGSLVFGKYNSKEKATEILNDLTFLYRDGAVEIKQSWDNEDE